MSASRIALAALLLAPGVPVCAQEGEAPAGADQEQAPRTVHEVVLQGSYKDLATRHPDLTMLLGGGLEMRVKPFYGLVKALDGLSGKGPGSELLLDVSSLALELNLAQLAELERTVQKLREAGIPTTAYLENASLMHYLAALSCDHIVMADMGSLQVTSPSLGVLFLKDVFDLLGVDFQVVRAGSFKGAVEPYMRSTMSSHLREHYKSFAASINEQILELLERRRGLAAAQVRTLQEQVLLSAQEAMDAGLVDRVVPWKGARKSLQQEPDAFEEVRTVPEKPDFSFMSLLTGGLGRRERPLREDSVAVIHLQGSIKDGTRKQPETIVSGPAVKLIRRLKDDPHAKGVVVRINSPGGSATASEAILLALRELAASKPVVVSMGRVAASGGYYVSCIGCPVVAEHATITGSIGAFGLRPNLEELSRKVGVHHEVVSLDDGARYMDLFRPLKEEQLQQLQGLVDRIYDRFLTRVTEARDMSREELTELAGGRIWSGAQAQAKGLVDHVGGLDTALGILQEDVEGDLPVEHFPRGSGNPLEFLESFLGGLSLEQRAALNLLRRAGFDLAVSLQLLTDAATAPGVFRVWMLAGNELVIR